MGYNKSVGLKATQQYEGQGLSQEKKKKVKDDSSRKKKSLMKKLHSSLETLESL